MTQEQPLDTWLEGTLDPYWEQGMEGAFLHSLCLPDAKGPYLLKEGDLLDIFDQDNKPLWTGTFQLRKRRFWERHKLGTGVYSQLTLKGLSYADWMAWQWSTPRLRARVLRPSDAGQIVYAQHRDKTRPRRLRDIQPERYLGRKIQDWSSNFGSYGMGGPGFFGLVLEADGNHPQERLVLTLWGAGDWLLLQDQWLSSHPKFYEQQKPLYSDFGEDLTWDHVSELLKGATLENFELGDSWFRLSLDSSGNSITLELPEDSSKLPKFGGSEEARAWNPREAVADAWVLTDQDLYC